MAGRALCGALCRALEHRDRAQGTGHAESARLSARTPRRRRDALSGSLHRRAVAVRSDPVWPYAAVGRARSPGKDWSRHRCGLAGQPFRSAGALPAGRAQRTTGGVSPRGAAREHRHGLGQLAARDLDGAWRVPRRAGARRERVQPSGLCGNPAASRRPRRTLFHLAGNVGRSVSPAATVPDHPRHRAAVGRRQGERGDRRVPGRGGDHASGGDGRDRSRAGRRVLVHPRPLRTRGGLADIGAMAAPARCQHRDDGRDAGAARGRAASRLVAGDQGQAGALG